MSNFVDMDILVVGSVVPPLAGIFDTYWNSPQAYPIAAIVGEPPDVEEARNRLDRLVDEGDQMRAVAAPPMDMLAQHPSREDLDGARLSLSWGRAVAFADQPDLRRDGAVDGRADEHHGSGRALDAAGRPRAPALTELGSISRRLHRAPSRTTGGHLEKPWE
ncbi:MAG TPA: hypothetical protein VMN56_14265 [Casimicrobiaceae bacterium]|nr:hypothetical protein [Casimicrobiaceae bacterium]